MALELNARLRTLKDCSVFLIARYVLTVLEKCFNMAQMLGKMAGALYGANNMTRQRCIRQRLGHTNFRLIAVLAKHVASCCC